MSRYEFDDDEPYVVIEKHESSVGSFLIGAMIGAGIALLLAPRSGEETRRDIQLRARRARRAARRVADEVTGTVNDTFQDARRRVEQKIDTAREAIELKKQQVQRAMEAGRTAAHEAREELERRIAETKVAYKAGAGVAGEASGARVPARTAATAEADEE